MIRRISFKLLIFTLLCCLFFILPLKAQVKQTELDRLVAFAQLAGNIRYFSPTDVADSMAFRAGWENIMWNGVRMSRNVRNEREFADSLIRYFKPIEPSLEIIYKNQKLCTAPKPEPKELIVSWQHKGLQLYSGQTRSFQSIRTNRRSTMADDNLSYFDFLSIRVPKGKAGKPFDLKLNYSSPKDKHIKLYRNNKYIRDMHLLTVDSVYSYRDSIPDDAGFFVIKIGLPDMPGTFSLAHDGHITVDGTKYSIKELTVLDVAASAPTVEWRIIENDQKLFDEVNAIGDTLTQQLTKNILTRFPLAVYADKMYTYPRTHVTNATYQYNKGLPRNVFFNTDVQSDLNLRLANVMLIWNVFRLSFVYNPFDEKSEVTFLRQTLTEVINGKNLDDYDMALRRMLHTYKDAHIFYINNLQHNKYNFSAPITLIHLKDGFYVKKLHDQVLQGQLNVGDKLLAIDGITIKEKWKKQQYFASGSEANVINNAGVFGLLYGNLNSEARLDFLDVYTKTKKKVRTIRNFEHPQKHLYTSFLERRDNRMLNDSTYYFNLSESPLTDTLLKYIDDPSKHIVFELRGYISQDSERKQLLNRLIRDTVVQRNLLGYHILSPTNKKLVSGPQKLIPVNRNPKAKFYFLIAESTQSAPETVLDVVKYWKLGTLIGKHTSGANGNINTLFLPGGIMVTFSGIKVMNSDGTEHHLKGITPDYEVDYTLDDVVQKRDPFLEKALELISKK
ncbi:MAG: hypothetical protein LBF27_28235 [Sphingobacterium sp.]|jgi:hypothetical protein|nr:hypothetical protein [Sphingobacterium sp.]